MKQPQKPQPVIIDDAVTIPPTTTKTITAFVDHPSKWNTTGTVTLLEKFMETDEVDKRMAARVTNTTESPYLNKKHTQIAEFSVVTPEQFKHIKPVDMAIFSLIPKGNPDLTAYLNELLRTIKPEQQNNKFWFPTPVNPGKPEDHTPIQTRILKELIELNEKEKLNPQESSESQNNFLKWFYWTDKLVTEIAKQAIEDILVEYHDVFARHRMNIGMNTECKLKLTPKDDKAVFSQSLPMPIHLKEDLIVELALMHKYGIITVLPFSKYASPILAQRKPNGKLLLVDLRKINNLIADDYTNNKHPVRTLSDATQHSAGKSMFCKLDCPQDYHCLQMADQQSVEMLAFNFASRTFANKRLAQGLSKSVSAFSSLMRESLSPVVKVDQCDQYVDEIEIAAKNATDLTRNIRVVFKCIRQAGLKMTLEKCHFGVRQIEFLRGTISPEGISPQVRKIENFLDKLGFPKSKKASQRYLGFVNYYKIYFHRMAEKLNPFYKLHKTEMPINITSELKKKHLIQSIKLSVTLAHRRSRNSRKAPRGTYVAFQSVAIFCSCYSLAANSPATQPWLLQNTASNTKFSHIFSIFGRLCFIILLFFFLSRLSDRTTILHIYTTRLNNSTQGSSMRHKRGESRNFSSYRRLFPVSMESPFEILERHDDHAHSDATSHEKLGLLKRTQNLGHLLRIASGVWLEELRLQISPATSLGSERFFCSACWRKKNGFSLAQEDQGQAQQLARTQRAPPQRRLIFSPLALMLFHSEGCHHDTSALLCFWQCDDAIPPNPNRHTDQWWPGLHLLTPQHSMGHKLDLT